MTVSIVQKRELSKLLDRQRELQAIDQVWARYSDQFLTKQQPSSVAGNGWWVRRTAMSTSSRSKSDSASVAIAGQSPQVARAIAEAIETLETLGANKVFGPVGFCHGDMGPLNMRIEGERVTFFDFDDCGRGPQLLDVAAMALWLENNQDDDAAALWRAFLAGYGVAENEELSMFVRWLVVGHRLRIVRFLSDYCEIEAGLWSDVLNDAQHLVATAARGELRFQESRLDQCKRNGRIEEAEYNSTGTCKWI